MERLGIFLLSVVVVYMLGLPLAAFGLFVAYAAFGFVLPVHNGELLTVVLGLAWFFTVMLGSLLAD